VSMILEGIRIIDWTVQQLGPVSTAMLGDMGADVIKIEQRGVGDPSRGMDRFGGVPTMLPNGHSVVYEAVNRNKRGISVDLKKEEGREIVYRLVKDADVFVQNFRTGVAARMCLDYQTLSRINPRLIYASGSGFGPKGPDGCRPAYDPMGQARSGIMNAVGEPDSPPLYITGAVADQSGGVMLAFGILAALLARERLGIGQEIHASHLGSMINLQWFNVMAATLLGYQLPRQRRTDITNPLANHYKCKDGKWIFLSHTQSDRYWPSICRVLDIEHLEKDPRFATARKRAMNHEELIDIIDKIFATRNLDEWEKILTEKGDFIFSRIQSVSDLPTDPQVLANDYIVDYNHPTLGPVKVIGFPVSFSKTPSSVRLPAPVFGQHTEEILMDVGGYTWEEIEKLKDDKVI